MKNRNLVAKNNRYKGGVHGRTYKAERKEMNENLMDHAVEEYLEDMYTQCELDWDFNLWVDDEFLFNFDNDIATKDDCPLCNQGILISKMDKNRVEYKGISRELDSEYCVCSFCGCELVDIHQAKRNKERMEAFREEMDNIPDQE